MKTHKCIYYEKQLYLYRAGELPDRERDRLNKHLASCPQCAAFAKKLKILDGKIEQLRGEQPSPDNPVALTNNIMRAVTSIEKFKKYQKADKYGNIFKLLFAPRLRFALLTAIVFIVSLFFIQEALFMDRIARLERKISRSTAAGIYTTEKMNYSVLENKLSSLDKSGSFLQNNLVTVKNKNKIVIDERSLTALLESYKSVKIQNELLIELLKNKNPDLYHITTKNGLDQAEIKELLRNKREILQFINEL